jgi:hypothetical protein
VKRPAVSRALRITGAAVLGAATFLLTNFAFVHLGPDSWPALAYRHVFGLAPFLARLADSSFDESADLILPPPYDEGLARQIYDYMFLGFWCIVFAALYYLFLLRARKTI